MKTLELNEKEIKYLATALRELRTYERNKCKKARNEGKESAAQVHIDIWSELKELSDKIEA